MLVSTVNAANKKTPTKTLNELHPYKNSSFDQSPNSMVDNSHQLMDAKHSRITSGASKSNTLNINLAKTEIVDIGTGINFHSIP